MHYLPSHSPELQPDEYLNNDLKAAPNSGVSVRGSSDQKERVVTLIKNDGDETIQTRMLLTTVNAGVMISYVLRVVHLMMQ